MRKLALLALSALTSGCLAQSALTQQHNPRSEYEAGVVTISASAPMRWENVVGELRPEFNSATARDYLRVVLPIVQQDFSSRREATALQVGVDVSGETVQRTETTETTAAGQSTTGRTVVSQDPADPLRRDDGSQVINGQITAPGANVFRQDDVPGAWPTQNAANVDPTLQYRAAVALHQELVLLDNYLDSAYDPCTQVAWLVRTRLVSTPYARNQPLDAHARIQAWHTPGGVLGDPSLPDDSRALRLVPLLVTDNFERSDTRRYEQLASQIQGSLNGVQGIVAAGLGFNRYLNNLNAILGSQYNNLLTISQINDSTLSVRLGAALSPASRYEMQSRSYDITFLVVIDQDDLAGQEGRSPERVSLGFLSSTEMRHAETGRLLPAIDASARGALVRKVIIAEDQADARRERTAARLLRQAEQAERARDLEAQTFFEAERERELESDPEEDAAFTRVEIAVRTDDAHTGILADINSLTMSDELRAELMRWYMATSGSSARLTVSPRTFGLPDPQTGVFRDSLTGGAQARVVGSPGLNPNLIRAELVVEGRATFAASSVAINSEGVIDAAFPSLGAVGINTEAQPVHLLLTRQCSTQRRSAIAPGQLPTIEPSDENIGSYRLMRNSAALAPVQIVAASFTAESVGSVGSITPVRGEGEARIRLRAIDDRNNPYVMGYEIRVDNAVLDTASGLGNAVSTEPVDRGTNSVRVSRQFGAYSLALRNLTPNTDVEVTVVGIGPGGAIIQGEQSAPVKFRVNPPANP